MDVSGLRNLTILAKSYSLYEWTVLIIKTRTDRVLIFPIHAS